jgi:hypothetical protein
MRAVQWETSKLEAYSEHERVFAAIGQAQPQGVRYTSYQLPYRPSQARIDRSSSGRFTKACVSRPTDSGYAVM